MDALLPYKNSPLRIISGEDMIKTTLLSPKRAFFFFCFCVIQAFSDDLPPADDQTSGCLLDFSLFPYKPSGRCIGHQESVKDFNTFTTTLCCQEVLNVLTKTLAWYARNNTQGNIFLLHDQWKKCEGPFLRQNSVSPQSCGFDILYNGSTRCSSFSRFELPHQLVYRRAVQECSKFGPSFDGTCRNCTEEVLNARDVELVKLKVKQTNEDEKMVCTVAAVIAVAAQTLGDPAWMEDYHNCLGFLNVFDDGYMRVKYSVVKAVVAVLMALFILMLVLLLIQYVSKDKRKRKSKSHIQIQTPSQSQSQSQSKCSKPVVTLSKEITTWSGLYQFSKAEIEKAINYRNERKSLGRGSAGHVYRGVLPSGQVVAIKHLYNSNSSDSFQREVENLSRVRHPNLVCLFGCCIEGGERYLVYEYCSAGNLAEHLLRKDNVLPWDRRVKILRDCAQGLRYLHHYVDGCIVHRDIKLTNILLTETLDPKLSDFGLARMMGMEVSKVFTDVRGTMGYMDPEYMTNAKLTCASDIYSFGIVALQLLSGQKVFELDLDAREQLTRKARDVNSGKRLLQDFEDPNLKGNVNREDFVAILQIAVLCVSKSSLGRPSINDVFEVMEKAWKNTDERRKQEEMSLTGSTNSRSMELMQV